MTYTDGPQQRIGTPMAPPPPPGQAVVTPVAAPVVERQTVVTHEPAAVVEREVHVASASSFAPDAVIAAVVGLVLLVVGLIALVRAGVSGPLSEPVVQVLGFRHTATLGIVEAVIGLCLLASGAAQARGAEIFFGLVLGVGGFVGAVQTSSFRRTLALESSMAWLCVVAAVVVVLSALLLPRMARRSMMVQQQRHV